MYVCILNTIFYISVTGNVIIQNMNKLNVTVKAIHFAKLHIKQSCGLYNVYKDVCVPM